MNYNLEKDAYKKFRAAGLSPAGACALIANLEAESDGFYPNRVEYLCLKRLRENGQIFTDETYTAAVDSGKITRAQYLNPLPGKQYGYGLAQWTSPGRKAGLWNLAKSKGVSIADADLQLDYVLMELSGSFPSVLAALKTAGDIRNASDIVLKKFECPADTGEAVCASRAQRGITFWNKYGKTLESAGAGAGVTAEQALDVMRGYVGMSRAKGTHKPIIDMYNTIHPLPRGYAVTYRDAYCAATVSAALHSLGAVDLIAGGECGVEELIKRARGKGIWQEDGKVAPTPGMLITYNWDDSKQPNNGYADHVGMVESVNVSKGTITAIEGNMDGGVVGRRTIPIGWSYIRGYVCPDYAASAGPDQPPQEPERPEDKPGSESDGISFTPKWVGVVTADLLNVRSWAGTQYANIKSWPQLAEGNLVDVCDTVKGSTGKSWYFVRIAGKVFGFVSARYIKRV